jgi:hypothetical protein
VSFHWQGRILILGGYNHFNILWGSNSHLSYYNYGLTNPQKGIWSFKMPDMINPQKGIDLMNNTSIINRILFAVTIFQHSPLTRRVFFNSIKRERGKHHQQHLGTLIGVSINHWKFFSSSIAATTQQKIWSIFNISNNTA